MIPSTKIQSLTLNQCFSKKEVCLNQLHLIRSLQFLLINLLFAHCCIKYRPLKTFAWAITIAIINADSSRDLHWLESQQEQRKSLHKYWLTEKARWVSWISWRWVAGSSNRQVKTTAKREGIRDAFVVEHYK